MPSQHYATLSTWPTLPLPLTYSWNRGRKRDRNS